MKILVLDTYYPEFLKTLPFDENSTYEVELRKVLDTQFGTSDFYSKNLRALGWDATDVIMNYPALLGMRGISYPWTEDADVLFLQDLNIAMTKKPHVLAGQLSCPWPGDSRVRMFDVLFTSYPHYVPRIEALGVRAVYLPLAFEPSVLEGPQPERDIDISFVGGVGRDLHWKQGTDVLEAVAAAFPTRFQWWGYGVDRLSPSSSLRACYKGEAWGRKMYDIYRRSKIVVNRHGEVAEGFANNMRMYEATGCGAMLLTDNRTDQFVFGDDAVVPEVAWYESAKDAIRVIRLSDMVQGHRDQIAANGQKRTLRDHTYAQRMKVISGVLQEMLCPA